LETTSENHNDDIAITHTVGIASWMIFCMKCINYSKFTKNIQLFLIAKITKWLLFVTYLSQMIFYIT